MSYKYQGTHVATVTLAAAGDKHTFTLPDDAWKYNVVVETAHADGTEGAIACKHDYLAAGDAGATDKLVCTPGSFTFRPATGTHGLAALGADFYKYFKVYGFSAGVIVSVTVLNK